MSLALMLWIRLVLPCDGPAVIVKDIYWHRPIPTSHVQDGPAVIIKDNKHKWVYAP